jgi:hippurate hydrolase
MNLSYCFLHQIHRKTLQADLDAEQAGGAPVASHHSPFFRIAPEPAVTAGTRAMTVAVLELLRKD